MKRVLVLQTKIGQKSFCELDNDDFFKFEKRLCIPSVQNWAKKNNYDYQLKTTSTIKFKNNFFPKGHEKIGACLFERYAHLNQPEYDYIIYIDTDVRINHHSPAFPFKKGVSLCLEDLKNLYNFFNQKPYTEKFKKRIQIDKYYNNGVFCVDRKTALDLQKFFFNKINCNDNTNMYHCLDQDLFNYYLMESDCKINNLNESWNYLIYKDFADLKTDGFIKNLNKLKRFNTHYFIHFAGKIKREINDIINFIL